MTLTDAQLRDQAIAEFEKTTDPYPTWVRKGKPASSHWAKGFAALAEIGAQPAPPPKHGAQALPQPPLQPVATAQSIRTIATPSVYTGKAISAQGPHGNAFLLMGYFGGPTSPPAPSPSAFTLSDLVCLLAGAPRSLTDPAAGTDQAGCWIGAQANLERIEAAGPWSGMETCCQARNSTFKDVTLAWRDATGQLTPLARTGLYIEHFSRRLIFDGLTVVSTLNGVNGEWAYADPMYASYTHAEYPTYPTGKSGSLDIEIRNFDITSLTGWGIFLDAGCCGYNIHDGVLRGLNGIAHPANLAIPSKPNVIDWTTIDFRGSGVREEIHQNPIG